MVGEVNNALAAVQAASGIAPDKLSLMIRTVVAVIAFIWGSCVLNSLLHHFRHNGLEGLDANGKIIRVAIVLTMTLVLVYVG